MITRNSITHGSIRMKFCNNIPSLYKKLCPKVSTETSNSTLTYICFCEAAKFAKNFNVITCKTHVLRSIFTKLCTSMLKCNKKFVLKFWVNRFVLCRMVNILVIKSRVRMCARAHPRSFAFLTTFAKMFVTQRRIRRISWNFEKMFVHNVDIFVLSFIKIGLVLLIIRQVKMK